MTTSIPISIARTHLGEIVKKVRLNKEYIILVKDGFPVVGMMDIDEFEDYLDAQNPRVAKKIAQSMKEVSLGKVKLARSLLRQ